MRQSLSTLLFVLNGMFISAALAPAVSADTLTPFRATYTANLDAGVELNANAYRELRQQDDGTWIFDSTADAVVARQHEASHFTYSDDQIQPLKYRYERKLLGRERLVDLKFNWAKSRVTTTVEEKPWSMKIPDGTQDKLSYQLQLRLDLAAGKKELVYEVADGGLLSEYRFRVIGEETVETPAGKFNALKVERVRGEDAKRTTHLWFAPELEYLIVKLYQVESDGKEYGLLLNQLENR
ncbi:DUF3108 domain-containing protein [Marinobacterium mangrovicola]|uniref:Uncharacterized protein DUF3108 n=1 Tax=Marinobacterium mangrovicola TaxID=1476959 RepID=A0A4R1GN32_9GAMM|nr:DUF3108 domain-containing protein [Marinobacterium mangrovicola]TCK08613.1 uncharacterized protein DUF3108 [Marinobacterium mangrovicola]